MWDYSPFLFPQDTGLTIHPLWGPGSSLAHFRSGSSSDTICHSTSADQYSSHAMANQTTPWQPWKWLGGPWFLLAAMGDDPMEKRMQAAREKK
ncbi:hypothetical protein L3X38_010957 [Prunus dulcis]|uniref:Uncharacterized protein n=1 Tax=Prunus dulcis TaxID=3755 RepID=A0AAD4WIZ0_PRUDU|nr:hypothetical protein L3X38_010957 [Prunus dulcis]